MCRWTEEVTTTPESSKPHSDWCVKIVRGSPTSTTTTGETCHFTISSVFLRSLQNFTWEVKMFLQEKSGLCYYNCRKVSPECLDGVRKCKQVKTRFLNHRDFQWIGGYTGGHSMNWRESESTSYSWREWFTPTVLVIRRTRNCTGVIGEPSARDNNEYKRESHIWTQCGHTN